MSRRPDEAGQGFLDRWSRRKREGVEDAPPVEDPVGEELQETAPEKSDEEILEELGLPDPDLLKEGDDFSAFMNGAVPTRLRNRALRKLWLSNPALANLDELLDYGEDFTDSAKVIQNMQTAYQVGKGWLQDVVDDPESDGEDESSEPENEAADAAPIPPDEKPEPEVEEMAASQAEVEVDQPVELAAVQPISDEPYAAPSPRRMRFSFD